MREQLHKDFIYLVIPIYNDWESLRVLLPELNASLYPQYRVHLLLVNDGSNLPRPDDLFHHDLPAFSSATCLQLKCNIGHQRAIATGLSWLASNGITLPVIIMDGDGEDKPDDLPRMLQRFYQLGGDTAVFAERTKRSESFTFKQFYRLYRWMHLLMVGFRVKIGNFSVLPSGCAEGLTASNYLWYHYAASVVRTRIPYATIKTSRGNRYRGKSQMNFISLVRHGVSAIAVHAEVLSVRMLVAAFAFTVVGIASLATVVWFRFFTTLAIPGWATSACGLIALLLLQILSLAFTFAMQSVSIHGSSGFIPARDCSFFIRSAQELNVLPYTRIIDAG